VGRSTGATTRVRSPGTGMSRMEMWRFEKFEATVGRYLLPSRWQPHVNAKIRNESDGTTEDPTRISYEIMIEDFSVINE